MNSAAAPMEREFSGILKNARKQKSGGWRLKSQSGTEGWIITRLPHRYRDVGQNKD